MKKTSGLAMAVIACQICEIRQVADRCCQFHFEILSKINKNKIINLIFYFHQAFQST